MDRKSKRSNKSNRKREQSILSPEIFHNENLDLLNKKMDELLASKERDMSVIEDLKQKLAESEEKMISLKEDMKEREQSLIEQRYQEKVNSLQHIIDDQNQNIKASRYYNYFRILYSKFKYFRDKIMSF